MMHVGVQPLGAALREGLNGRLKPIHQRKKSCRFPLRERDHFRYALTQFM